MALIMFLAFSLLFQGTLGELVCEKLPSELCSFSVASSGKRCLLENYKTRDGGIGYQCKTSDVNVEILKEWIESDECVNACGVDRKTVGISSDSLLNPHFMSKLCANSCFLSCPNIVDLYFNLAAAEGAFLPKLCENPRSAMYGTRSSSEARSSHVASGPAAALAIAEAPTAYE